MCRLCGTANLSSSRRASRRTAHAVRGKRQPGIICVAYSCATVAEYTLRERGNVEGYTKRMYYRSFEIFFFCSSVPKLWTQTRT